MPMAMTRRHGALLPHNYPAVPPTRERAIEAARAQSAALTRQSTSV